MTDVRLTLCERGYGGYLKGIPKDVMLDNDMPLPLDCRRIPHVSFRSKYSYFIHKSNALC